MFEGMGQYEQSVLSTLPGWVVQAMAEDWRDPRNRSEMVRLLRAPDPRAAIAKSISAAVAEVVRSGPSAGMGEMSGLWGKVKSGVKGIGAKIGGFAKKFGPKLIAGAGIVAAPFTSGGSLAGAS